MGGVELSHMLLALYHINPCTNLFYLQIIFYLIVASVVNRRLLYCRHFTFAVNIEYMNLIPVLFRSCPCIENRL